MRNYNPKRYYTSNERSAGSKMIEQIFELREEVSNQKLEIQQWIMFAHQLHQSDGHDCKPGCLLNAFKQFHTPQ